MNRICSIDLAAVPSPYIACSAALGITVLAGVGRNRYCAELNNTGAMCFAYCHPMFNKSLAAMRSNRSLATEPKPSLEAQQPEGPQPELEC